MEACGNTGNPGRVPRPAVVVAVDPEHHQQGIGRALVERSFARTRAAGMTMVMAETGDDPGHEGARRTYEALGFERWPVARYFADIT